MKHKLLFLAGAALLFSASGFAQKIKVTSGDLDFLKDQKTINVEYKYDNMGVGKYDKEEDYIHDKVSDYNADEPGKGDEWKKNWIGDRESRYEPKFEELINIELEKPNVKVGDYPEAAYTMILSTVFTEPGFNVGVMRKNAYVDYEITFVKTDTQEEVATMSLTKSPGRGGMGFDFDTGYRIQEAYAKAGKELGQYLSKKVY